MKISELAPLAEPLLLHSLDLNDHMVLNDHANLTVPNTLDGEPDLVEHRIGGRNGS